MTAPQPPELPDELAAWRDEEDREIRYQAALRRYAEAVEQEKKERAEEAEREWERIRVPIGIMYRDPRDLQGL